MKNLSPKTKTIWATYNFQDISLKWWNAHKVEHEIQYLKWPKFVEAFRKRFIPQVYFDKKYEEYYTLQQGSMSVQNYHQKFIKILKYVLDD